MREFALATFGGFRVGRRHEKGPVAVLPLIIVGASNAAGGATDDPAALPLTAEDMDASITIYDPNANTVRALDNDLGIPRPGDGAITTSTTPAINFAKEVRRATAGKVIVVLIPTAVGGRKLDGGSWDPDGAGPAWTIGGSAAATDVVGALYLAHANGTFRDAALAAIAAEYPGFPVLDPVFFGSLVNENDTGSDIPTLLDKGERGMNGIRSAWNAPTAPWVTYGGPPEFSYDGGADKDMIAAVNLMLAERMTHVGFARGVEGNTHSTEPIHYSNVGYRIEGTYAAGAYAAAVANAQARPEMVDWADDLTNKPARLYSLYRGLSTYTGPLFQITNGTTTLDISADSDGYPDIAAMLTHAAAGSDSANVKIVYDQMGSGATMIPEGTGTHTIVNAGAVCLQGKRIAWGENGTLTGLVDASYDLPAAGALLALGHIRDSGNCVLLAAHQSAVALYAQSGVTRAAIGSVGYDLSPALPYEPAWLVSQNGHGLNTHGVYADAAGVIANGEASTLTPNGLTGSGYGTTGVLSWGMRSGATNRSGGGAYTLAVAWDVAPTGADRELLRYLTGFWARKDDV
ncbi:hypothetical protein [Alloyangia pacifica]|uniref:Uncharacterized protein n=1 Tax=Alloyangia pacifica TaxID=311180 RepID=A0A1I6QKN4_9RHOB|nr:hypothetical protein [Alloyangia pacifica]SDF91980.1 hypothetical protein SAMN04488245_101135 [Alloyangia pacifica]SFS53004.1 hypothetical protein SAMN04488050_102136 [Alloyangia pacifica]